MGGSRGKGFTLIELMVVISLVAILLALGLPSFQSTIRSNRLATQTNQLIASIALTRSEALRTSRGAAMCPSTNGTACGGTWSNGWLIWADVDGDATIDGSEPIVRYVQGNSTIGLTSSDGDVAIAFNGRGGAVSPPTFTLRPTTCPASTLLVNTLTMNGSGQIKTSKSACP